MKIPLRWLAEYVKPGSDVRELAERMTLAGLEVSGFRFLGHAVPEGIFLREEDRGPVWDRDKIVVAQVLKIERHPNADKLKLVTLDYGATEPKTVVTGAPNIEVGESGHKVVLGLCGTRYWDGHVQPRKLVELQPKALRGIMNDAMVMSEFELGITEEHEGIILLPADAIVGTPIVELLGDVVLEVDVLPNMARCLGMIGVAREVSALTGAPLTLPDLAFPRAQESIQGKVAVSIDEPKLSTRYQALLIRGVKIGPSPAWMQQRLSYAGMRPINNIVDITNYVMLEWGQPLHAFDFDVLTRRAGGKAPHIIVRPARSGEKLVTLDKVERELTPEILVIADEAGPIALAGVMGGLETEVTPATTTILLESASFDYVSIRKTARALNLPSEASLRFSRGIHPEMVQPAASRAALFMAKYASGEVLAGEVDCYPAPPRPRLIALPLCEIKRLLGVDIPAAEATRILTALGFTVVPVTGDTLTVTVPPNRLDIQDGPADLIEDLARISGYDRLPARLLSSSLPEQQGNTELDLEERVRNILVESGLNEAVTYALTVPGAEAPFVDSGADYVTLLNPISDDRTSMRRTLLAGLLTVAAENRKHTDPVRLFEIGPVYWPRPDAHLPDEPRHLAFVLTGRRQTDHWTEPATDVGLDFFDLKGIVESLAAELHLDDLRFRPGARPWLHPGKSAEVLVGETVVGCVGELHPRTCPMFDLSGKTVIVGELDLDVLLAAVPARHRYSPTPRFPAALRDIAIVVNESLPAEQIQAELRRGGGDLLREIRLFDVYRGPSIPPGTKSLAFALTYQAADRTLKDKEVDDAHKRIENRVKHVLQAQIRGK